MPSGRGEERADPKNNEAFASSASCGPDIRPLSIPFRGWLWAFSVQEEETFCPPGLPGSGREVPGEAENNYEAVENRKKLMDFPGLGNQKGCYILTTPD